ncbi:MAG: hypothetical protein FJ010_00085 [Chloroflexi bacterium]|nr:hypothetical protein [Chloroflexota bacterium]
MDIIRETTRARLRSPLIVGIVGFIVGLLIGWIAIGWGIWPVKWTDASPADLEDSWREDYLLMAVDSYASLPDTEKAIARWNGLGTEAAALLAQLAANPGPRSESVRAFQQAVGQTSVGTPSAGGEIMTTPITEEEEAGGKPSRTTLILIMCGVVAILAVAVAAFFFLFRRQPQSDFMSPMAQAQEYTRQAEPTDFTARGEMPPMSQFMTTYMLGDDLFDDSFSIDSPTGEFLGECGVGISESIGVGEPKKVAAYEVWLFDKNDIQTVTKVLMSKHAYDDSTLRDRLQTKGEPFQAEPGAEMILETATLRLVARVVDMAYGSGPTPPQSYFERLTLELAIWQRA